MKSCANLLKIILISSYCSLAQAENISLIAVGDIMLGTNYPSEEFLPPDNGKQLMQPVNAILSSADITFGNLEGTVLDAGGTPKGCSNPSRCFAFRMPESLMDNIVTAGFDVLSIANNHVGDFGAAGRSNTSAVLQRLGIAAAGLESKPTTIFQAKGLTIGFAAFAPNQGTADLRDIPTARRLIQELAKTSDMVIVSFHGGAEGSSAERVTRKTENFYGENRGNVYEFAHAMIDAGADVILGHGPHVSRAIELYKNRFIAYSLGNFCTYGRFNLKGANGFAPILHLTVTPSGEFVSGKITPILQIKNQGVQIDPAKQAITRIRELTQMDFPESPLVIANDGSIAKTP